MRINFKISKAANKYFFISNLTEWHFSSRSSYNKVWLEKSGPLSFKEKEALRTVKRVIKSKLHYGRQFFLYPQRRVWTALKRELNPADYLTLKNAFNLFDRRFEKVWLRGKLVKWKSSLEKAIRSAIYQKFFKEVERLFSSRKARSRNLTVHLLPCPVKDKHPAGSANLGSTAITLEVPVYNSEQWFLEAALAIIAHEFSHILLDDNLKIKRLIEKSIKRRKLRDFKLINRKRPSKEIVQEILIDIFVPTGYLSHKFLKEYSPLSRTSYFANLDRIFGEFLNFKQKKLANFYWLEAYLTWQLYPLAAYYVERGKSLDSRFVEEVLRYFE